MKRTIIFITIISLFIIFSPSALAAIIEIDYPPVRAPGGGTVTPSGNPAVWVQYIFYFSLGLVSIAAVGSLVYGGIVWMTAGSSGRIEDAKARIKGAILGILLVAGSVVLLRTINPELVSFKPLILENISDTYEWDSDICDGVLDPDTGECVRRVDEDTTVRYQWAVVSRGQQCSDVLGPGWTTGAQTFCNASTKPEGGKGEFVFCCGFVESTSK